MRINRLEIGFAALLFGFGLFIVIRAVQYGIFGPAVTGTGFFPALSGALLVVSSGGVLGGFIRGSRTTSEVLELAPLAPVAAIVALTVVFLLVVESVGMLALTPVYVGAVAFVIERPRKTTGWLVLLSVALGFTLFAWLLFDYALRVPLPRGIF